MARNSFEQEEPGGGERVAPLSELPDVEVADGKPDIRGWEVVGHDRRTIGQVHDLIVDIESIKVRYVDVEMRREAIEAERDRHVLVPIGYARLEEDDDRVRVNNIVTLAAGALPAYEHGPLTRAEEMSLHRTYAAASPAAGAMPESDSNYYGHERFDDSRFWGRRQRAAEYLRRLR
jgi:sporulation protein YlmC with PRC-barrel domain